MLAYPPFLNVPRVLTLTKICTDGAPPLPMTFTGEPVCVPVHWCTFDGPASGYSRTPRKRTMPLACFGDHCRKHDLRLDWQVCVCAIAEFMQREKLERGKPPAPPKFRLEHVVMDLPSGCVRQLYRDFEGVFRGRRSQLYMRRGDSRVTVEHLEPVVNDADLKPALCIAEVLCARWGYPREAAQIEVDGHGRNILRFREPPNAGDRAQGRASPATLAMAEPKSVQQEEGDGEP